MHTCAKNISRLASNINLKVGTVLTDSIKNNLHWLEDIE